MEKKKFEVETVFIIASAKKSEPFILTTKNSTGEMDFFRKTFEVERVGFNQEKAQNILRDFLITDILGKGVFADTQKMVFDKVGMKKIKCKYYINLKEPNVSLKNTSFLPIHKAMDIKNKLSDQLREFLINYVTEKRNIFDEDEVSN